MNKEGLDARVASVSRWFHEMDLGHGVMTPGPAKLTDLKRRADIYFGMGVTGRSVLDVGAWDGFYSFEAERRGASRVLAVDKFCWAGPGGDKTGFDLAHGVLKSNVEHRILDIDETTREAVGSFDIVLFNGIIYHIVDPVHALIQMSRIATQALTVETYMDMPDSARPAMVFYPGEKAAPGTPQFGWGVNSIFMHAFLKHQGFETILEFPTPDAPTGRSTFLAFQPGHDFQRFVEENKQFARPRSRG